MVCKGISYFLHRPRTANPSYHLYSHLVSCLTLSLSKCSPVSPLTIRSQFPSHMPLFSSRITPSHHHLSVCYCNSSTLLLFFCYFLFPPFSHSFSPPLPLRFFIFFFFFSKTFCPLPKGGGTVWWTWIARNKSVYRSVVVSLALPLWSSAESKVFIKRNLPNLPLLPHQNDRCSTIPLTW